MHYISHFHNNYVFPYASQSNSELLFTVVYPVTGGQSGMLLKNKSNPSLKELSVSLVLTLFGKQFQSLPALTLKNWSYELLIFATDDGMLGITATFPLRILLHQVSPTSFGTFSCRIFHAYIKMYHSRRRWRDISLSTSRRFQ